ncbi:MAG: hypothetical protein JNM72_12880 [Deltaproteobacteria bacterium]|nr:hypothetical protein [Deltaproteobacteria bacterium]
MGDESAQSVGVEAEQDQPMVGEAAIIERSRPRHGEQLSAAELLRTRRCFIVFPAHDDEFGGTAGWPVDADDPFSDDARGAALEWASSRYGATVGNVVVYCRVLDPDGTTETHVEVWQHAAFDKGLGEVMVASASAHIVEARDIPSEAGPWERVEHEASQPSEPASSSVPSPWGTPSPRRRRAARPRPSEVPDVG